MFGVTPVLPERQLSSSATAVSAPNVPLETQNTDTSPISQAPTHLSYSQLVSKEVCQYLHGANSNCDSFRADGKFYLVFFCIKVCM